MKAFKAILMTVMLGAAMSATAQVTNQLFDKGRDEESSTIRISTVDGKNILWK